MYLVRGSPYKEFPKIPILPRLRHGHSLMLTPRVPMVPGSTPFTVCISVASVSAFLALLAIVLILVWLFLRQVSPREREEELEARIADLQRRLRVQDSEEWGRSSPQHRLTERVPQRQDEDLKRAKEELALKIGELSKAWELNTVLEERLERLGRKFDAERKREQVPSKQNERLHQTATEVDQLERMRSQINDLSSENARLKAQVGEGKKRFTEMNQTDSGMRNRPELQGMNRAFQGKELRSETTSTQPGREWEMKLDDERKRYQDLLARNQYLQDELKAARKYGSMEDQYAGAEVIDKVETLNSIILQVAATVAEGLDLDEWANDRVANGSHEKVLGTIIGRDLAKLLRLSESQDLNILLQTAFQASMTYHTALITSSWCYRRSSQEERLFDETYRSMQRDELQAVSGRWRQLAMTHLKDSKAAYGQHLLPRLASTLADIVVAAGYRQDAAVVRKQITDRFTNRLEEVIKAAQDLHKVIGEDITSCDLEVVWLNPGTPFDAGAMEDTFGPTTMNEGEEVACVTDVGLRSRERLSGSMKRKQSVLLKPKVLLPSGLAGIRIRDS